MPETPNEVDPTEDPSQGDLPATNFPPDEFPDPEQTPEDLGKEDGDGN